MIRIDSNESKLWLQYWGAALTALSHHSKSHLLCQPYIHAAFFQRDSPSPYMEIDDHPESAWGYARDIEKRRRRNMGCWRCCMTHRRKLANDFGETQFLYCFVGTGTGIDAVRQRKKVRRYRDLQNAKEFLKISAIFVFSNIRAFRALLRATIRSKHAKFRECVGGYLHDQQYSGRGDGGHRHMMPARAISRLMQSPSRTNSVRKHGRTG